MLFQIVFSKRGDDILQNGKPTTCSKIINQTNDASLRDGENIKETESQKAARKLDLNTLAAAKREYCDFKPLPIAAAPAAPPPSEEPRAVWYNPMSWTLRSLYRANQTGK